MAKRASRTPEARHDVVEIAEFISNNNLDAATRFIDAVESTVSFLLANPHVGQQYSPSNPLVPPVHIWPIDGFRNHLIFFRPTSDGIEIVRILHGARDLDSLFRQ